MKRVASSPTVSSCPPSSSTSSCPLPSLRAAINSSITWPTPARPPPAASLPLCLHTTLPVRMQPAAPPRDLPVLQSLGPEGRAYAFIKTLVHDKARITVALAARLLPFPVSCKEEQEYHLGPRVAIKITHKDPPALYATHQQPAGEENNGTTPCTPRPSPSSSSSVLVEQARAEIRALHRLSHPGQPNVIGIVDSMEDEQGVYVVLPYLPGRDLCDKMMARKKEGGISERKARFIISHVLAGLLYIKAHGMAHGDVSLENVMMDEEGTCKLIDLGMVIEAKQHNTADGFSSMQVPPTHVLGKPSYMCPEAVALYDQLQLPPFHHHHYGGGDRNTDDGGDGDGGDGASLVPLDPFARDAWGLGIVLFILLLGCPLYTDPQDPAFALLCDTTTKREEGTTSLQCLIDCYASMGHRGKPSREACDLLHGLLQIDPKQRMTLEDVQRHPWMMMTTTTTGTTTTGAVSPSSPPSSSAHHHHHHHHHHHYRQPSSSMPAEPCSTQGALTESQHHRRHHHNLHHVAPAWSFVI